MSTKKIKLLISMMHTTTGKCDKCGRTILINKWTKRQGHWLCERCSKCTEDIN